MVLGVERFRLDCPLNGHGPSRSLLLSFLREFLVVVVAWLGVWAHAPCPLASLVAAAALAALPGGVVWAAAALAALPVVAAALAALPGGVVWAAAACLWLLLLSLRYLGLRLLPLSPRCLLRRQLALRRCVASLAFAALRFDVDASLAFTA